MFAAFCLVMLAVFHRPLQELISFSYSSQLFFYILLVPFVSIYFLYAGRKKIFSSVSYSYLSGSLITLTGIILFIIGSKWQLRLSPNDFLAVKTLSALITGIGGFVFFYGIRTFRYAAFPICFLFLMVPIPAVLLDHIVVLLQKGSTEAADGIFTLTTLPVQRDGFVFTLSNLAVEVAEPCSGIRSSLYLLLTSLVMGQFFLKKTTHKILLVLAVVPITIFKNGLRIVTLSLLGNYVHASILSSNLHRRGGIPFMILAVILLSIVTRWIAKSEKRAVSREPPSLVKAFSRKGGHAPHRHDLKV